MSAHPFWRFSLRLYAQPGVEAACLALQAQGVDVNVLLLCCWLGRRGGALDRRRLGALLKAVGAWQQAVVLPLRQLRRTLKRPAWRVDADARLRLRRQIVKAELEAERLQQLWLASRVNTLPCQPGKDCAAANVRRYSALLDLDAPAERHFRHVLDRLQSLR